MPSKTPKQAKLMRAVAHGWHPDQFKGPSKKVAQEFTRADKAKDRKKKLDKWAGESKARRARNEAKSNISEYRT